MKRNSKRINYLILGCVTILLLGLVLTSCSAKYEYTPASNRTEIYNSANEDSTYIDSEQYSTERADYYFENSLKDKQKDSFVDTAEQILNDYPMNKVKFVVGSSFNTSYVGKSRDAKNTSSRDIDTVFFNINDLSHIGLLVELNALKYGEKTPYGLRYAVSYGQCVKAKYPLPKILDNSKLCNIVNNSRSITDLNTFTFLFSLSTEDEKLAAKTLSVKLYEQLGLERLLEIIENDDIREQQDNLNFYIKTICYELGIVPQLQAGIIGYECYHTQKYIVAENSTLNVRFFIAKDYSPTEGETHIKRYSDLKASLMRSTQSFVKVNEFIGNDAAQPTDFYCYKDAPNVAYYDEHFVQLALFDSVVHEYTHIAMAEKYYPNKVSWTVEGIAEYCAYEFDNGENTDWGLNAQIKNKDDVSHAAEVLDLLMRFPPRNKFDYCDIRAYVTEKYEPKLIIRDDGVERLYYSVAGSLSNYLIETYGKEKYLELCCSDKPENVIYGKDLYELRSEWFASLQARFGELLTTA